MALILGARFHTLPEAKVAASYLASAGLSPVIFDQHYGGLDWVAQSALGGYRLMLPAAELSDARGLLSDPQPGELPPEEAPPPIETGGEFRAVAAFVVALVGYGEFGWILVGLRRRTAPSWWEAILGGLMALFPFLLAGALTAAVMKLILDPP